MILDPVFIFCIRYGNSRSRLGNLVIASHGMCHFFVYPVKMEKASTGRILLLRQTKEKKLFTKDSTTGPAGSHAEYAVCHHQHFMARTASTYGGHIGLMTLTAGGQIEAIASRNTSQGFSTALSAFVAQNYAASERTGCWKPITRH